MTEELQRLIEEAQPLAAADHQHGAEQGAGGAAEPAEDDNNQQLEGEHKVEQPRGNGGQQGSQQTAADPFEEGAGGEGAGFNAEGVDPHGDRRIFIVANSFHHPAILRPHQLEDHAGGQQGEQPAPEQEMRLLRNIVQPDGAVGDLRVVNGEDLDDKPKAEGDNGQVVATYPEDRHGEAHRQRRRAQAAYQQGREEARVQAEDPRAGGGHFKHVYLAIAGEDQQGGDVGAHRHEAVRLQRQLAGHAVDQVVADREDHKDKNGADDTNNVVIENHVDSGQQRDTDDNNDQVAQLRPGGRRRVEHQKRLLSRRSSPIMPTGRNKRTRIKNRKAKASL